MPLPHLTELLPIESQATSTQFSPTHSSTQPMPIHPLPRIPKSLNKTSSSPFNPTSPTLLSNSRRSPHFFHWPLHSTLRLCHPSVIAMDCAFLRKSIVLPMSTFPLSPMNWMMKTMTKKKRTTAHQLHKRNHRLNRKWTKGTLKMQQTYRCRMLPLLLNPTVEGQNAV